MEPNLTITIEPVKDDHQVVKFTGEFDKAGHSAVKEELEKAIKEFPAKTLFFDFAALKFINSEGIGYLMEIHAHLVKNGKELVIVGPNAHVKDVFKAIGLDGVVPVKTKIE